jgi:chromosome segregation ATPase
VAGLASQRQAQGRQQAELQRLKQALDALRAEQTQARRQADDALAQAESAAQGEAQQAAARVQALQQQLAQATALAEERRMANTALVARLAERSQALRRSEYRVARLHALGQQAVLRYRNKSWADQLLQHEPVLGLAAVRIESRAELLDQAMDDARAAELPADPNGLLKP